jgi:hypothetical protein
MKKSLKTLLFITLFSLIACTSSFAVEVEKLGKVSFSKVDYGVNVKFSVTAVGSYDKIVSYATGKAVEKGKRARTEVGACIGIRYSKYPDKLFVNYVPALGSMPGTGDAITMLGDDKNGRPRFKGNFDWDINIVPLKNVNPNASAFSWTYKRVVDCKNWGLGAISDPSMAQVVVFIFEGDAKKGKNIQTFMVPIEGNASSGGFGGGFSLPTGDAIPAAAVFGLMFLALGLAGASNAAGSGSVEDDYEDENEDEGEKDKDKETNQEEQEKDVPPDKEEEIPEGELKLRVQVTGQEMFAGDDKTEMTIYAEIIGDTEKVDINSLLSSISLAFPQGDVANDFINVEESMMSNSKKFALDFRYEIGSEFYAGDTGIDFPHSLSLRVQAPEALTPNYENVEITLKAPEARIAVSEKRLIMAEGSSKHPKLTAFVVSAEAGEWEFKTEIVDQLEVAIESSSCNSTGKKKAEVFVKAAKIPEGAGQSITSELKITATNKNSKTKAERIINVTSAKEGLVLVSPLPIRISADGKSMSEIEVTALKVNQGRMETDVALLQSLRFDPNLKFETMTSYNAFETSKIRFGPEDEDRFDEKNWKHLKGFAEGNISSYLFKAGTKKFIPGQNDSYFAVATLTDGVSQSLKIPLMLDIELMEPFSEAWQLEYERCQKTIELIPEKFRPRMYKLLGDRAVFLGAPGIYLLRKRIWKMGMAFWQAEGLKGYEDLERWAGYIEDTLNFAQWAGRMATDYLIANKLKLGIFAAMAVGELYDLLLSIIIAYRRDYTFDEWLGEFFWKEIKDMLIQMGASGLDPDKIVAALGNNKKVKLMAWCILFGYHTMANIIAHKMSLLEAVKKAAISVTMTFALKFFAKKAVEMAKKKKLKLDAKSADQLDDQMDAAAKKGWADAQKKVDAFEDAIKSGDKRAIKKHLLKIQSDKFALKQINKCSDSVKKAYNKEIGKMYASIDRRVKKKIIQDLRKKGIKIKSKDIKMTNATNKTGKIKVGSDRDISAEYSYIDKNGKKISVEVPKEKLRDIYGRELYKSIGHKNAGNAGPDELMEKYDQYALDSRDGEAYGSKKFHWDNKKIENRDFNRAIGKKITEKFDDAQQVGKTVSHKAKIWFNRDGSSMTETESFKMEGMSQIVKQYKNIFKPRMDYAETLGKSQPGLNKLKELIGHMEKAVNLEKSPSYVEKLVKKAGYSSLNEFSDSFGGRIEAINDFITGG